MGLTLLVLAAGMGSRYGGLKQVEGFGPSGETLLEYNVYDALRAGFTKVVFVIREEIREDFEERVCRRLPPSLRWELAFQERHILPAGFVVPEGRTRPWGTGHAVWCARHAVKGPFAMINADDYYGSRSFAVLARELYTLASGGSVQLMVAYRLGQTLSTGGSVSRGLCRCDNSGFLDVMTEVHGIARGADGTIVSDDSQVRLDEDTPVSMNLFGFSPEVFEWAETELIRFLEEKGQDLKAECYIPYVINEAMRRGETRMKVLDTPDTWMGVTHPADRAPVKAGIASLMASGAYPNPLWGAPSL